MLPRDIRIDPIPFVGTFGKSEAEVAAAWIVIARRVDNSWNSPLTMEEIFERVRDASKKDARVQMLTSNPFLTPSAKPLLDKGYLAEGHIFTEAAMEKLKAFVEVAP